MQASAKDIKKTDRLLKRSDFLRVQRQGNRWVAKGMIVQIGPGLPGKIRLGITVSKKISKSAVVRNRIKRRLRAAACDVLPQKAAAGFDIVMIGRVETAVRPYAELKKDLSWCLGKLGGLKENP